MSVRHRALGDRSGEERLVGVHGRDGGARRQRRDLRADFGAEIDGVHGAGLDVVRTPGSPAGHDQVDAAFDDFVDGACLQIDRRQAGWRRDDQLRTVRRVRVLVEVEALAARFVRQADDAMTGVGISPLARRFFRR